MYDDDDDEEGKSKMSRTGSLPNLSVIEETIEGGESDVLGDLPRPRSYSDRFEQRHKLKRNKSDTDLRRINRRKTFASISIMEPTELLVEMVGALSGATSEDLIGEIAASIADADEDDESRLEQEDIMQGVELFSEKEILASEYYRPSSAGPIAKEDVEMIKNGGAFPIYRTTETMNGFVSPSANEQNNTKTR